MKYCFFPNLMGHCIFEWVYGYCGDWTWCHYQRQANHSLGALLICCSINNNMRIISPNNLGSGTSSCGVVRSHISDCTCCYRNGFYSTWSANKLPLHHQGPFFAWWSSPPSSSCQESGGFPDSPECCQYRAIDVGDIILTYLQPFYDIVTVESLHESWVRGM